MTPNRPRGQRLWARACGRPGRSSPSPSSGRAGVGSASGASRPRKNPTLPSPKAGRERGGGRGRQATRVGGPPRASGYPRVSGPPPQPSPFQGEGALGARLPSRWRGHDGSLAAPRHRPCGNARVRDAAAARACGSRSRRATSRGRAGRCRSQVRWWAPPRRSPMPSPFASACRRRLPRRWRLPPAWH